MDAGPSQTAMLAAAARAAHLFRYGSRAVLGDWLAWPLLGQEAESFLAAGRALLGEHGDAFATWIAARSRVTEDWLSESDAARYVILGAGLDSFAWRQRDSVQVFELDHPSTQTWKQSRLAALGIELPETLHYVPVDFEHQRSADVLSESRIGNGSFVSWLGVTPYLTKEAIGATLSQLPAGDLAVTYLPPATELARADRSTAEALRASVEGVGEPWISFFEPNEFAAILRDGGFAVVDDLGSDQIEQRHGLPCINYERIVLARR